MDSYGHLDLAVRFPYTYVAMRKLEVCEHCQGKKSCAASGGRSCKECLSAAGASVRQWATVRCSYCGGMGRVWVEVEEQEEKQPEEQEAKQADQEAAGEVAEGESSG